MQILFNILTTSLLYLLVSLSFYLIYSTTKFFHFAHAAIITLGSYLLFTFLHLNLPLPISLILSFISVILLITVIELFIYRQLRKRNASSLILLITSIGLYVIIQNLISLIWGDDTKSIRATEVKVGHEFFNAYITNIQIVSIVVSISFFILTILLLNKTQIGLKIRAVSSNDELSNIFGIESNKVILWSFIIGSLLAAVAGILVAFDIDMTPTMGFNLLLYGVVAMIIGGIGSIWGLIGGSLLLATAQHLGAYHIDSKWMDAIAYIILILFLIWKPLGFSGKRLKKIEI